jgi:hypothetical protein
MRIGIGCYVRYAGANADAIVDARRHSLARSPRGKAEAITDASTAGPPVTGVVPRDLVHIDLD